MIQELAIVGLCDFDFSPVVVDGSHDRIEHGLCAGSVTTARVDESHRELRHALLESCARAILALRLRGGFKTDEAESEPIAYCISVHPELVCEHDVTPVTRRTKQMCRRGVQRDCERKRLIEEEPTASFFEALSFLNP
jgi:hypothetical protein